MDFSTMRWQRHVRDRSYKRYGLISLVLGCAGGPLMIATGVPVLSIFFFTFGLMAVPFCFPRQLRATVGKNSVIVHPPPAYRNPLLWLPVGAGVMGVSAMAQYVVDNDDSGRLFWYGLALCAAAVYLAIYAYRVRGAVDMSAHWVTFVHGKRYSLTDDTFGLHIPPRGAPSVKFVHAADPSGKASFMPSNIYGFDVNTMLSTLEQLRVWAVEDQHVTPALIMAMLAVEPPTGVDDVGASVEIPVSVAAPNPTA